jgi:hypothetical protein
LKNVIIGDEAWVYGYDVAAKHTFLTLEESPFASPQESTTGALASERNVS